MEPGGRKYAGSSQLCLWLVEQPPEAVWRRAGPPSAHQHRQVGAPAPPLHQHAQCQHQVVGGRGVAHRGMAHSFSARPCTVLQHTLQQKSHFCISFLGIARPQSRFSTFMCLWAIYIFPGSVHIFPAAEQTDQSWEYINRSQIHERGFWDCGHAISFLGISVSNFRYWFFYSVARHWKTTVVEAPFLLFWTSKFWKERNWKKERCGPCERRCTLQGNKMFIATSNRKRYHSFCHEVLAKILYVLPQCSQRAVQKFSHISSKFKKKRYIHFKIYTYTF